MNLLTGKEAAARVRGILHEKYQVHGHSVDLTVKQIYVLDPTGRLDFGGSEYSPAGRIALETAHRHPEDPYAWWDLARGSYFVEYNESVELAEDEVATVEAHDRLLRAGAGHSMVYLRGRAAPLGMLLHVGALRLEIKQNARISRLRLFRLVKQAGPAPARPAGATNAKKAPRRKAKLR
jgi:deoxycytidine triphosphate deaminase